MSKRNGVLLEQEKVVVNETEASESRSQDGNSPSADPQLEKPTFEAISIRAFELWTENGRPFGSHEADWRQAEADLQRLKPQSGDESKSAVAAAS